MIKLLLPTKDLIVFYRAWQWFCLLSRTGFFTEESWSKNSHAWCLNCSGKQLYSLRYCQWYRYLSLINISQFFRFHLNFCQGKAKDNDKVNYHVYMRLLFILANKSVKFCLLTHVNRFFHIVYNKLKEKSLGESRYNMLKTKKKIIKKKEK